MLRFFQRAKKLFPSISVGSINLLTEMGIFNGILWPLPLQVKLTLRSGCAVKSVVHSMLTICWNWAPASTVESTVLTCRFKELVNSGLNVTLGWKFCGRKKISKIRLCNDGKTMPFSKGYKVRFSWDQWHAREKRSTLLSWLLYDDLLRKGTRSCCHRR